jgi:hypothetical protein
MAVLLPPLPSLLPPLPSLLPPLPSPAMPYAGTASARTTIAKTAAFVRPPLPQSALERTS